LVVGKPFPMTLRAYFELIDKEVIDDKKTFSAKLFELEILRAMIPKQK
jgi:hypothetical protein